jgi:hypothetical protein
MLAMTDITKKARMGLEQFAYGGCAKEMESI